MSTSRPVPAMLMVIVWLAYSRDVYGWLSRPYADISDRSLESPPQTSVCECPMCTRQNPLSLMATNPHKFFVTSTASYADLIQR